MRILVLVLSFLVCFNASAQAQEITIEDVITAQIEAFRQNDVETAFTLASPKIQQLFGSPEKFGNMVRDGYPMVWRPADVSFLRQRRKAGVVYQEMRFFDAAGAGHSFVYEMVQVSGSWKIDGVYRLKSDDVSA
jgi:hypothetical protein